MTVTLSWAQSLDGRIATRDGNSRWISGDQSLLMTHQLRADHDAIMVGSGTVLKDNPQLTCRRVDGSNPHRYVLDSHLQTPLSAHVANISQSPTTIVCASDASSSRRESLEQRGLTIVTIPADENGLDLRAVLDVLAGDGVRSLMVEGGSAVLTSFLRRRLATDLVITLAPLVIGTGTEAVGDLMTTDLDAALRGSTRTVEQYGNDIVWRIRLAGATP